MKIVEISIETIYAVLRTYFYKKQKNDFSLKNVSTVLMKADLTKKYILAQNTDETVTTTVATSQWVGGQMELY